MLECFIAEVAQPFQQAPLTRVGLGCAHQPLDPLAHGPHTLQQAVAQGLDIGQLASQRFQLRDHGFFRCQAEGLGGTLECLLDLLAEHRVIIRVREGIVVDDDGFLARGSMEPGDHLQPQPGQRALHVLRIGFPTGVPGQNFPRQRIPQPQSRHEIERVGDQRQHPPVGRIVRDAEFPLDSAQRHDGLLVAHAHHHHRGGIGIGAAEQRLLEDREHAVLQLAVGGFVGIGHDG